MSLLGEWISFVLFTIHTNRMYEHVHHSTTPPIFSRRPYELKAQDDLPPKTPLHP